MRLAAPRIPIALLFIITAYMLGDYFSPSVLATPFELTPLSHNLQHLDLELLKNDFWHSLLNLHAQPPLWNFVIGGVLIAGGEHYLVLFRLLYALAGIAAVYFIHKTLLLFGLSKFVRAIVIGVLCLTPTLHCFGTWFYCTHFEFTFFAVAFYFLCAFFTSETKSIHDLAIAFIFLALLGLLRSQWHLAVLVLWMAALLVFVPQGLKKRAILCTLIFIIPLTLLYTKNYARFGMWGATSWFGAGLSQVAAPLVDTVTLNEYKKAGKINPLFPVGFYDTQKMQKFIPNDLGIRTLPPVLSAVNKKDAPVNGNYIGIVYSSASDLHDSLFIIRHHMGTYALRVVQQFWNILHQPSMFYPYHDSSPIKKMLPERLYPLFSYSALWFYCFIPLLVLVVQLVQREYRNFAFFSLMLLFANLMLLIGCAFNGLEQERMRWGWQPIYVLFAAIFLEKVREWWHYRRHGRTA